MPNTLLGPSQGYRHSGVAVHGRAMMTHLWLLLIASVVSCTTLTMPDAILPRYDIPASIAADCSSDVTAAIQAWIASVPDSSTIVFGQNACYNIDGGLVVADRNSLTLDGNGSTFKVVSRGTRDRANWTIKSGSNLTLKRMIAVGANPHAGLFTDAYDTNVEGQHAYRIEGTQGVTLDSVQAYDVWGDFVGMEPDWRLNNGNGLWVPVRDVVVRNSTFARNGRMGISPTNVDRFTLENSTISEVRWSAIDIELDDNREFGQNIRIVGNHFGRVNHHLLTAQGAGMSASVGNILIARNVMDSNSVTCLPPIAMKTPTWQDVGGGPVYWSTWIIAENTLRPQTGAWAIDLTRAKAVTIANNTIESRTHSGCSQNYTVRLVDSHDIGITNNTLTEMGNVGTWWTTTHSVDSLTTDVRASGNIIRTAP